MVTTAARENRSAQSSKHQRTETEGEGERGGILAQIYLSLLLSHVLHRALAVAYNAFGKDKFLPAPKEASDSQWKCKTWAKEISTPPRHHYTARGVSENCLLPPMPVSQPRRTVLSCIPPPALQEPAEESARGNQARPGNKRNLSKLVCVLNISRWTYYRSQVIYVFFFDISNYFHIPHFNFPHPTWGTHAPYKGDFSNVFQMLF